MSHTIAGNALWCFVRVFLVHFQFQLHAPPIRDKELFISVCHCHCHSTHTPPLTWPRVSRVGAALPSFRISPDNPSRRKEKGMKMSRCMSAPASHSILLLFETAATFHYGFRRDSWASICALCLCRHSPPSQQGIGPLLRKIDNIIDARTADYGYLRWRPDCLLLATLTPTPSSSSSRLAKTGQN
jgi:hypothetical protein